MIKDSSIEKIVKASVQGGSLAALARYTEPNARVYVPFSNTPIPLWVLAGGAGVGASFVADVIHEWILPHIPVAKKYSKSESAILAPAINAGSYLGVFYLANPASLQILGAMTLAGEAVGAEILASYVSNQIF